MAARELHHLTLAECWALLLGGFALGVGWEGGTAWYTIASGSVVAIIGWRRWRGHCGLDQYPRPYGRFYLQWLRAQNVGDYYPWLAEKMCWRDPWRLWVELEKGEHGDGG